MLTPAPACRVPHQLFADKPVLAVLTIILLRVCCTHASMKVFETETVCAKGCNVRTATCTYIDGHFSHSLAAKGQEHPSTQRLVTASYQSLGTSSILLSLYDV